MVIRVKPDAHPRYTISVRGTQPAKQEETWLLWLIWILLFILALSKIAYGYYCVHRREQRRKKTPYRVVKDAREPGEGKSDKRVVAVVGGTGFVGTHIVNSLIEKEEYRVLVLGRNFRRERVNPKADALIQVDMTDPFDLFVAFKGVDTVVHAALALPTVYTSAEEVRKTNELATSYVLLAAMCCDVQNLVFVSRLQFEPPVEDWLTTVMLNCFKEMERKVIAASLIGKLRTCVIRFGNMYGVHSPIFDKVLNGGISRMPLLGIPVSLTPVEFAANVVVRAERKLAENDERVVGNVFKVAGRFSTIKNFFTVPEWQLKVRHMPLLVLKFVAHFNLYFTELTDFAPMGTHFIPSIASFFELREEMVDNAAAERVLGIGTVPNIKEGVKAMVERHKKNNRRSEALLASF